jgi:hypothetical protein
MNRLIQLLVDLFSFDDSIVSYRLSVGFIPCQQPAGGDQPTSCPVRTGARPYQRIGIAY